MNKFIAAIIASVFCAGVASADLIATWGSFTGGNTAVLTTNNAASNVEQLTISNLDRGGATLVLQTTAAGNYVANNWTGGGYFFFTLNIASGYQLTDAEIVYRVNGTTTSPGTMGWSVDFGSALGGGSPVTGTFVTHTNSIGTLGPGLYTLSFAPVGTLNQAGTGAFTAGGGIRLNNSVTLSGSIAVVPEPASAVLFTLGLVGIMAGRRAYRK